MSDALSPLINNIEFISNISALNTFQRIATRLDSCLLIETNESGRH